MSCALGGEATIEATEVLLVVVPVWAAEDTTGVAGISTGMAWPFGNLKIKGNMSNKLTLTTQTKEAGKKTSGGK